MVEGSDLTHEEAIYSGKELFADDVEQGDTELFKWRGGTLSEDHEPIFMEDGSWENKEQVSEYMLRSEAIEVPGRIFVREDVAEQLLDNIATVNEHQISKVENLKSNLEKLLDKLCLA